MEERSLAEVLGARREPAPAHLSHGRLFWIVFLAALAAGIVQTAVVMGIAGLGDADRDGVRNFADDCPAVRGERALHGCPLPNIGR